MNVALLPAKPLALGKSRLAPLLPTRDRIAIGRAMFTDVLTALCEAQSIDAVIVVTADEELASQAESAGAMLIREAAPAGLNTAVIRGTGAAVARDASTVLVVLSDIPWITAADVDALCRQAPPAGALVVPSKEGTFTNALLRRPATLFRPLFGPDSLRRHVAAAKAQGLPCPIVPSERIGFDVDTPADLRAFAAIESATATYRETVRLGLATRRPVAQETAPPANQTNGSADTVAGSVPSAACTSSDVPWSRYSRRT